MVFIGSNFLDSFSYVFAQENDFEVVNEIEVMNEDTGSDDSDIDDTDVNDTDDDYPTVEEPENFEIAGDDDSI